MCALLLSIKPEHVRNIVAGIKKFEYRRVRPRMDADKIVIYSTSPEMKVVAEVDVSCILQDSPEKVWEKTKKHAGISKAFFDQYYSGRSSAVAYQLGKVHMFNPPKSLADFNVCKAPQSFIYLL